MIGGGIAGLVAARDLAAAGLNVCLFEAEQAVGGRIKSASLAGMPVELGAEAFATRGGAVETLARELGLGGAVVRPAPTPAWVITPDRAHPLPAAGSLGIPTKPFSVCRTIGLRAALWAAIEPLRPRSRHTPDASIAEVARARLGARVTEALIAPVVAGVYSAAPEKLRFAAQHELAAAYARTGSLVRAAREIRRVNLAAGGAVASFDGGLSQLVSTLVTDLQQRGVAVHTGLPVHEIVPGSATQSWTVRGEHELCCARAVVIAAGPDEVRRLLGGTRADSAPKTESARGIPVADLTAVETVALVVDAPALGRGPNDASPRGTGALISPDHPRIAAKALTHATAKWGWLRTAAPAGRHVLRLSYGSRDTAPATAALSDDAAAALALSDASAALGVALDRTQLVAHARGSWRIPARAETPHLPDGLFCTSEAYAGTGLASVVPHARGVAQKVIGSLARVAVLAPPG